MAGKRDRIIKYLESLDIQVNICKNKARGNKGFFRALDGTYRIDIAKGLSDDEILRTLVHEYMHYIHYNYDKKMKSLEFLFDKMNNDIEEELIQLTVEAISKKTIKPFFDLKSKLEADIEVLEKCKLSGFIELQLKQRALNRIDNKIARLNRYYNRPSELLARSFEAYVLNRRIVEKKAPKVFKIYNEAILANKIPLINNFMYIADNE